MIRTNTKSNKVVTGSCKMDGACVQDDLCGRFSRHWSYFSSMSPCRTRILHGATVIQEALRRAATVATVATMAAFTTLEAVAKIEEVAMQDMVIEAVGGMMAAQSWCWRPGRFC